MRPDTPQAPVADPDAAILKGGPGDPVAEAPQAQVSEPLPVQAPEPAAPEHVTVRLGELDVKLPPDQADAVRRLYETERTRSQQLEQLVLRQPQAAPAPAAPEPARPATDYGTQLFTNPNEVLAQIRREAVEQARSEFQPIRQQLEEFRQQNAVKQFYSDFYQANADLRGSELIVEALATKNLDRLKTMSVDGARDELARLARQAELDVMKRRAVNAPAPPVQRTVIEGASPVPARAPTPTAAGHASLSETVKARRAARRAASHRLN